MRIFATIESPILLVSEKAIAEQPPRILVA